MKSYITLLVLFCFFVFFPIKYSYTAIPILLLNQIQSDTINPTINNGFVLIRDTVISYDPNTYEEMIMVNKSYVPIKEYHGDMEHLLMGVSKRSQTKLIEVRDTSTIYDSDTFEEIIEVTIRKLTEKEYAKWIKKRVGE